MWAGGHEGDELNWRDTPNDGLVFDEARSVVPLEVVRWLVRRVRSRCLYCDFDSGRRVRTSGGSRRAHPSPDCHWEELSGSEGDTTIEAMNRFWDGKGQNV